LLILVLDFVTEMDAISVLMVPGTRTAFAIDTFSEAIPHWVTIAITLQPLPKPVPGGASRSGLPMLRLFWPELVALEPRLVKAVVEWLLLALSQIVNRKVAMRLSQQLWIHEWLRWSV
jgi:hypothetical protein